VKYRVIPGASIKYSGRTYADGAVIADGDLPADHMTALSTAGIITVEQADKKRQAKYDDIEAER
jgi:hypothetical protein